MDRQAISGKIVKISGPVLDVRFNGALPHINELLSTEAGLRMEVSAHIKRDTVRCVALEATDGLCCGTEVICTGAGIKVPVGKGTLGRVVNVLGEPIDDVGPIEFEDCLLYTSLVASSSLSRYSIVTSVPGSRPFCRSRYSSTYCGLEPWPVA